MEAGHHYNPMLLDLEEDSVREAPNPRSPPFLINNSNGFSAIPLTVDSTARAKRSASSGRTAAYHALASRSQTTGNVTIS